MTYEFLRKERCGIHMFAGGMHVLNTAFFPLTVFLIIVRICYIYTCTLIT